MAFVNLVVGAHILPVDVAAHIRVNQHMIKMRIELCLAVGIGALHLYATQALVPAFFSGRAHSGEIPSGILGLQVLACILNRHIRNPDFISNIMAFGKVEGEIHTRDSPFCKSGAVKQAVILPYAGNRRIHIEFSREINLIRGVDSAEIATHGIALA